MVKDPHNFAGHWQDSSVLFAFLCIHSNENQGVTKKMKQRLWSILMAMVLCLTMLPVTAFAEVTGVQDGSPVIGGSGVECSCGAEEGAAHAEDCPLYEEPEPEAPVCAGLEGCTGDLHAPDCPLYVQPQPTCGCETRCTAETVNASCPVCGAENADLAQCTGAAPVMMLAMAPRTTVGDVFEITKADGEVTEGESGDYTWDSQNGILTITGNGLTISNTAPGTRAAAVIKVETGVNTLTLKNVNIEGEIGDDAIHYGAIYAAGPLEIKLEGTNTVYSDYPEETDTRCGIYVDGDLTISGSGNLKAANGQGTSSYGIYSDGILIINTSGKITATGGIASSTSVGIYGTSGVRIESGTVETTGGTANSNSYGIQSGTGLPLPSAAAK